MQFGHYLKVKLKDILIKRQEKNYTIPFVDGKPIYPIPAGFVEEAKEKEEEKEKDPTKAKVDTARVREDGEIVNGFTTPDTKELEVASSL